MYGDHPKPMGWFQDPYHVHEARYVSDGKPTKLVRDGRIESYDPRPGIVPGPLVPLESSGIGDEVGPDLEPSGSGQGVGGWLRRKGRARRHRLGLHRLGLHRLGLHRLGHHRLE
jgi:hypothetical protein